MLSACAELRGHTSCRWALVTFPAVSFPTWHALVALDETIVHAILDTTCQCPACIAPQDQSPQHPVLASECPHACHWPCRTAPPPPMLATQCLQHSCSYPDHTGVTPHATACLSPHHRSTTCAVPTTVLNTAPTSLAPPLAMLRLPPPGWHATQLRSHQQAAGALPSPCTVGLCSSPLKGQPSCAYQCLRPQLGAMPPSNQHVQAGMPAHTQSATPTPPQPGRALLLIYAAANT